MWLTRLWLEPPESFLLLIDGRNVRAQSLLEEKEIYNLKLQQNLENDLSWCTAAKDKIKKFQRVTSRNAFCCVTVFLSFMVYVPGYGCGNMCVLG